MEKSFSEDHFSLRGEDECGCGEEGWMLMIACTSWCSDVQTGWRKHPRSPTDFTCSTSVYSSCHSSIYNQWLFDYYNELLTEQAKKVTADVGQQVHMDEEFVEHPIKDPPLFPPLKTFCMDSTNYYGPEAIRRHWPCRHGKEYWFFPCHYPHLPMTTRYGRFLFQWHVGAAVPEMAYKKTVASELSKTLQSMVVKKPQVTSFMLCDTMVNMAWCDPRQRMMVIRYIAQYLRLQRHLVKVCFENARLEKIEGVVLLCALSEVCGSVVRELHIWKMFAFGHNPLLIDELSIVGKCKAIPNIKTGYHLLEILNDYSALTHLSANYSYLANRQGDALLELKSVNLGRLQELRLLCLGEQRPLKTNPGYGEGGFLISDGTWREAVKRCPGLKAKFVFVGLSDYEDVVLFLSKSIPMKHFHLSSGINFKFPPLVDMNSTLLELHNWYSETLESLSIKMWHHRDEMDFILRRKILVEFPNLVKFEYIGELNCFGSVEDFCSDLATGQFKLKYFAIWVQERYSARKGSLRMLQEIKKIKENYHERFMELQIDGHIQSYPI